eukprot:781883-Prorocentrum_lima.AAC.1
MTSSLVGSEMCIRDSHMNIRDPYDHSGPEGVCRRPVYQKRLLLPVPPSSCLLYTSDAADDM